MVPLNSLTFREPVPDRQGFQSRLLPAIMLLGIVLRWWGIESQGLWLDEAFSIWISRHPLPELLHWLASIDQHPPIYYLWLHFWLLLGDGAAVVRSLSALAGAVNILIFYRLGQKLIDARVGILAAFLLAISPFHIRFAQEARMYTWLTLNISLALLALINLLTNPKLAGSSFSFQFTHFLRQWTRAAVAQVRPKPHRQNQPGPAPVLLSPPIDEHRPLLSRLEIDLNWAAYILFTALSLLTHHTALFFPIATNCFVLGLILVRSHRDQDSSEARLKAPPLRSWLWAQLGIFLLWSPWLGPFVTQAKGVYESFWLAPPDIWSVTGLFKTLLSAHLPPGLAERNLFWLPYLLILSFGAVRLRRFGAQLGLLLLLLSIPILGELWVSLYRPIFYDRTLIWVSLPLLLLLATGIYQIHWRPLQLIGLTFLSIMNGISLGSYYRTFEKEAWDEAAAYVAAQADDDDLILFNATWVQIPFDYYFRAYARPVAKHGVPADLFDRGVLEPKMTASDLPYLSVLIQGRRRVWLVYSHNWYTDPQSLIPNYLEQQKELRQRQSFYGLEIQLYESPP